MYDYCRYIITLIFLFLAPSTPPQSLVLSLGSEPSTEIIADFSLPQSINQNGVLINYTIIITGITVDTTTSNRTFPISGYTYPEETQLSASVTGLEEYNEYNISVFVSNSAGSSPISDMEVIMTNAAGNSSFNYLIDFMSSQQSLLMITVSKCEFTYLEICNIYIW